MHQVSQLSYGPLADQFIRLHQPRHQAPVAMLVVVHGGYWKHSHTLDTYATHEWVDWVEQEGLPVMVANVEYRRVGGPYAPPSWQHMVADVRQALNVLAKHHCPSDVPMVVVGHSAGGHLAALACSQVALPEPLQRVPERLMLISAVLDIEGSLSLGSGREVSQPEQVQGICQHWPPVALSPACAPPLCSAIDVWHGLQDDTVPAKQAKQFRQAWPVQVASFRLHPQADHFSMFNMPDMPEWQARPSQWLELTALLRQRLGVPFRA